MKQLAFQRSNTVSVSQAYLYTHITLYLPKKKLDEILNQLSIFAILNVFFLFVFNFYIIFVYLKQKKTKYKIFLL